jgi:modification target Cys-rich repeat protein
MTLMTRVIADLQDLPEIEPMPSWQEHGLAGCQWSCKITCTHTCGKLSCGHTSGQLDAERAEG